MTDELTELRRPPPRRLEVVQHLSHGLDRQQVARVMGITESGVSTHIERLFLATETNKVTALVALALRKGWIE